MDQEVLSEEDARKRAKELFKSFEEKKTHYAELIKNSFDLNDIVILSELFGKVFSFSLEAPFDTVLTVSFRIRNNDKEEKEENEEREKEKEDN